MIILETYSIPIVVYCTMQRHAKRAALRSAVRVVVLLTLTGHKPFIHCITFYPFYRLLSSALGSGLSRTTVQAPPPPAPCLAPPTRRGVAAMTATAAIAAVTAAPGATAAPAAATTATTVAAVTRAPASEERETEKERAREKESERGGR